MNIYENFSILIAVGSFVVSIFALIYARRTYRSDAAHYKKQQIFINNSSGTNGYEYKDKIVILNEYTIHNHLPNEILIRYMGAYLQITKITFLGIFLRQPYLTISIAPTTQGFTSSISSVKGQLGSSAISSNRLITIYGDQFQVVFRTLTTKEKINIDEWIKLKPGSVFIVEVIVEFPKSFVDLIEAEKLDYRITPGLIVQFHNDVLKHCLSSSSAYPIKDDTRAIELLSLFP